MQYAIKNSLHSYIPMSRSAIIVVQVTPHPVASQYSFCFLGHTMLFIISLEVDFFALSCMSTQELLFFPENGIFKRLRVCLTQSLSDFLHGESLNRQSTELERASLSLKSIIINRCASDLLFTLL